MTLPIVLIVALFGLLIGSFLNVVTHRLAHVDRAERQGLGGRSLCPSCGNTIGWYDNLPLISWIILRGRCRHCSEPISIRYPLVELGTALLWAAVAASSDEWRTVIAGVVLMSLLVPISLIDLQLRIIPNELNYVGIVLGLALSIGLGPQPRFHSHDLWWLEVLLSALGAALFLHLPNLAISGSRMRMLRTAYDDGSMPAEHRHEWEQLMSSKWQRWSFRWWNSWGMGLGDVRLAFMLGAFLGSAVAPALMIGFLVALIPSIAKLIRLGVSKGRRSKLPFGPSLAIGGAIAWFAGSAIVDAYLQTLG